MRAQRKDPAQLERDTALRRIHHHLLSLVSEFHAPSTRLALLKKGLGLIFCGLCHGFCNIPTDKAAACRSFRIWAYCKPLCEYRFLESPGSKSSISWLVSSAVMALAFVSSQPLYGRDRRGHGCPFCCQIPSIAPRRALVLPLFENLQ